MDKHPVRAFFDHFDNRFPPKTLTESGSEVKYSTTVGKRGDAFRIHAGIREKVKEFGYLEYAMTEPIYAVTLYRSGILIRLTSPERFAFHKLLVSEPRSGDLALKRMKDIR